MVHINRKTIILLSLPVLIIVLVLVVAAGSRAGFSNHDRYIVAKVDGHAIYAGEFAQRIEENRAAVFEYFSKRYEAEDSEDFWSRSFGREVPGEMVRKLAMDQSVRIKVQQILARKNGILQDDSYLAFLDDLRTENERRKAAIKNNEIIYGPEQYGEAEYFNYVFSNMIIRLKEKLAEKELYVAEDRLKVIYTADMVEKYKNLDLIKILKIVIPFTDEAGNVTDSGKQAAREKIEAVAVRLYKGEKFEDLAKQYNAGGLVQEQTFGPGTARDDAMYYSSLLKAAARLSPGQASGIIEMGTEFDIIWCAGRKDMGYKSFDEVKDAIRSEYTGQKYEELIIGLVKKANVQIDRSAYFMVLSNSK